MSAPFPLLLLLLAHERLLCLVLRGGLPLLLQRLPIHSIRGLSPERGQVITELHEGLARDGVRGALGLPTAGARLASARAPPQAAGW